MSTKSRTIYVSAKDWEKLEQLLKDTKGYCNDLMIDSPAKLMHVLANLPTTTSISSLCAL